MTNITFCLAVTQDDSLVYHTAQLAWGEGMNGQCSNVFVAFF